MGDRQRFQSQYEQDRGRGDYRAESRGDYDNHQHREHARPQPREWEPSNDYRRADYQRDDRGERDRYASYYNERQFGARGRDEREQGSHYGSEEEWRPWPSDSGYAGRPGPAYGRESSAQRGQYERSYGQRFAPSGYEDTSRYIVDSFASPGSRSESLRRSGLSQGSRDSSARYPGSDYARSRDHEHENESFGHQLREAGQRIARSVKRAFRGPKGYKRSDERIREDISDRLGENEYLDVSEVEVSVSNGEVTLIGVVHSRQEKFLVEEIADDVSGVHDVHNQLRLKRDLASTLANAETVPGTPAGTDPARARNTRS